MKWKFFHSSLLFLLLSNFDLAVPILRYMFIYSQQLLQMTVVQIQMIPETWPFFKLWCSWSQILALQISEKAKRPFANDVFSWDRSLFTRVLFYYVETLFSMDEYQRPPIFNKSWSFCLTNFSSWSSLFETLHILLRFLLLQQNAKNTSGLAF